MKRLIRHAALAASLAVLLAACGGGVGQIDPFQPTRLLAFGDELSVLQPDGRKYAINGMNTDATAIDCEVHPLWIQTVATLYSMKFSQCQGTATEAKAVTRAVAGATVAGVTAQIDAQVAGGGLNAKDLVLVMAGMNDIKQIYEARTAADTEATLIARAQERGKAMADQVNRMVGLGAKVIVSTAPDLGITPWGESKGTADAGLLKRLSAAFNGRLRVNIINDGRYVGLVLADEMLQSAVQVPSAFGLVDVDRAACRATAVLPGCNNASSSLVEGASALTWLWADDLRFGVVAHQQLGSQAAARAQTNPF